MSIATSPWNDDNRFNQTGYSGATLFPLEENYIDKGAYLDDLDKAEAREVNHLEFIEELKEDARMDAMHDAMDIEAECELDDDEPVNEGYI